MSGSGDDSWWIFTGVTVEGPLTHDDMLSAIGLGGVQALRGQDYVVSDALGQPIHPDTYSAWFKGLAARAGLPFIGPHGACRTAATSLSTLYGAAGGAAASYLGHDPLTYHRTCVLGDRGHGAVGDALSRMQTGTDGGNSL